MWQAKNLRYWHKLDYSHILGDFNGIINQSKHGYKRSHMTVYCSRMMLARIMSIEGIWLMVTTVCLMIVRVTTHESWNWKVIFTQWNVLKEVKWQAILHPQATVNRPQAPFSTWRSTYKIPTIPVSSHSLYLNVVCYKSFQNTTDHHLCGACSSLRAHGQDVCEVDGAINNQDLAHFMFSFIKNHVGSHGRIIWVESERYTEN